MTAAAFLGVLFKVLGVGNPTLAGALLWLLGKMKVTGVDGPVVSEAAPDDFKKAVKDWLNKLAEGIQRPLVKSLFLMVIPLVTDAVLDQLWDRLFGGRELTQSGSEEQTEFFSEVDALVS